MCTGGRKCLPYQGIARRALLAADILSAADLPYDRNIDVSTVLTEEKKKRSFNVIDRQEKENMNCKPLHDNVLVRRAKADDVSKGGIFIPTTAQEKTTEGEVVAAGDGLRAQDGTVYPLAVKPGDRVLFEKHAGAEVKIDGEDLVVLREFNIICILK